MSTKAKPKPAPKPKPEPLAALPAGCPVLLGRDQMATAIGVSRTTLDGMISAGKLVKPDFYVGRLPRWKPATLQAWIDRQCESKE